MTNPWMLMLSLWTMPASAAEPICPTSEAAIGGLTGSALGAYSSINERVWRQVTGELWARLPCVDQPLGPETAAAVLRVAAMEALGQGQPERVRLLLRGAVMADAAYRFPDDLIPAGNVLAVALEEAQAAPLPPADQWLSADLGPGVSVYVSGALARLRPPDRPALVQVVVRPKGVLRTEILWPDQPMPADLPDLRAYLEEQARRDALGHGLNRVSGAVGLGAAALLGAAWTMSSPALDGCGQGCTRASLALGEGGAAAAGAALALAGVGIVVRW